MDEKALSNSRIYTDIQSVKQLGYEYKKNPEAVKKEVTKQFEAFLVQMMVRSMREANKAFASDLTSGQQMDFYQDMLDKQLSLQMPDMGIGFENSLDKTKSAMNKHSSGPLPWTVQH